MPVVSRLVIEALGVDLPVVSGALEVAGNRPGMPLCDVAQYLVAYRQPSQPGTTYLYAHAQRGMLLPLLTASERDNGQELMGLPVDVYTTDGTRYRYEILTVQRHATDYRLADSVRPGDRRLVIQTSEGPEGTVPKLQVAAELADSETVALDEARPSAEPRVC
ncbi:MAG TPA: hypothetical protein VM305_08880 [Candidatus Limnocylindrales bacterium]|nr:hypothetical protein [Candidatus Limnocylindrales bacterium]